MSRRILFFGNCQALYLHRVFEQNVCPLTGDRVRYLGIDTTDFANPDHAAAVLEADILVDQVFDVPDPIPPELLAGVKTRLRIPNLRGDFLWPFNLRELHPLDASFSPYTKAYYGYENGDSFLNRMIVQGVPAREAVDRYMTYDFRGARNVQRLYEICLDRQQRRDKIAGLSLSGYIDANRHTQALFSTPGHPFETLLLEIARPVLTELLPGEIAARALAGQDQSFGWRKPPIHPGVGRALSLQYISEHTRYMVYNEGYFTFEEYALRYMRGDCIPELNESLKTMGRIPIEATVDLVERALAKSPTSALAHRVRARLHRQLRQPEQALLSALQANSLEPEDPQNLIELIDGYLATGAIAMAESLARLAVSRFPRQSAVYHCLCTILARLRNRPEFEKFAAQAIDLHPGNLHGLLRIARLYLDLDAASEAEQILGQARRLEPRNVRVAELAADILHRQGRRPEAIAALRAAIEIGPAEPHMVARMAHLLYLEADLAGAEAAYRRAAALSPGTTGFRAGLADVLDRQGRRAEAIGILREAIAQGQPDPHVHARLGRLLIHDDDLTGAEQQFRQAVALDPHGTDFNGGLADVLDRQGRATEAIALLRRLATRRGDDPHVQARLGHVLLRAGELDEAEVFCRRAVERDPGGNSFHGGLIDVLDRQGQRAAAIAVARDALSRPGNEAYLSAKLAHLLTHDGDLAGAEAAWRRAAALDPSVSGFQNGLIDALERQGRRAEAIAAGHAGLSRLPDDPQLAGKLAHLLLLDNEVAAAEALLRRAIAAHPATSHLHCGLAMALERQDRRAEALLAARAARAHAGADPHNHGRAAHLLTRLGDLAAAEAAYRQALALDASLLGFRAALADVLERQGRRSEAAAMTRVEPAAGSLRESAHATT